MGVDKLGTINSEFGGRVVIGPQQTRLRRIFGDPFSSEFTAGFVVYPFGVASLGDGKHSIAWNRLCSRG